VSALDVLKAKEVPDADKLWCVLREECLSPTILRLFLAGVTNQVLIQDKKDGFKIHPMAWEAIKTARAYARGKVSYEILYKVGQNFFSTRIREGEFRRAEYAAVSCTDKTLEHTRTSVHEMAVNIAQALGSTPQTYERLYRSYVKYLIQIIERELR
jgi:hypothetical protein